VASKSFSPKKAIAKKSFVDDHIRSIRYIPGVGSYSKTKRWGREKEDD
jgi:hypothetical protein